MLEFEEILRKYELCSENEIRLIEGKTECNDFGIGEIRNQFLRRLSKYNKEINSKIEDKKSKEELLLNNLLNSIDESFVNKVYINEKDTVELAFNNLMNNRLYVLESEDNIRKAKDIVDYLKSEREKYEDSIVNKVKRELENDIKDKDEIEGIANMIKNSCII